MPIVDTLRLKTRLSGSGMPEDQAQVLVEELDEALTVAITAQVATKADLIELRAAINALEERFEQRFEQVDQRFEQVDKRFEQVERRFERVEQRVDDLQTAMHQMKGDIRLLRWMGGTILVIQLGILVKLLFG